MIRKCVLCAVVGDNRVYKFSGKDIDAIENWWIEKSRVNFLAYRKYLRPEMFLDSWFQIELSRILQQFYIDYKNGKRPVYIINTPPQHGKSVAVGDLISWLIGREPKARLIFASYAERLGKRANANLQRTFLNPKYGKIFPTLNVSDQEKNKLRKTTKNSELIEFFDVEKDNYNNTGFFRNTTVNGAITGDTMDVGFIDDPVKGRKEARSPVVSQSIFEWYEDDFESRMSEYAGTLIIMTRWVTHDLTARIKKLNPECQVHNFQAIATEDEEFRKAGEPLFPELKSLEFLKNKKKRTSPEGWESLYQGNPTITGGNLIKDDWWRWWKVLPQIKWKFITADTAQKTKNQNDWTDFKAWGVGVDGNLYLLDHLRAKLEAPELRKQGEIFYKKHDTKRNEVLDPILRGMYIEDKSSGTGLLQEFRRKRMKVIEVPRNTDKMMRADDAIPFIQSGRVYFNTEIPHIDNTTKEAREFPNSQFDDDLDTVFTAIEIVYINGIKKVSAADAMRAR